MFYYAEVRFFDCFKSQIADRSSREIVGVDKLRIQQEGGQEEGNAMHSADQEIDGDVLMF
jgi:hypothetical protein